MLNPRDSRILALAINNSTLHGLDLMDIRDDIAAAERGGAETITDLPIKILVALNLQEENETE